MNFVFLFCDLLQKSGEMWLEPKSEVQLWNTDPDAIFPPPFFLDVHNFQCLFHLPWDTACLYVLTP